MLKRIFYTVIVAVAFLLAGCSKETVNKEVNDPKQTSLQFIGKEADLSIFQAALERIELAKDPVYLQNGPYTFFAPVDSAFKKAGLDIATIRQYDRDALRKIIYGHILIGRLGGPADGGFFKIDARCLDQEYKPVLSRSYYGLFLNGYSSFGTADLGDGIIHKISGVAFPGTDNVWELIRANPQLTMLTAGIEKVSGHGLPYMLDLKEVLQFGIPEYGWTAITGLCPTDEAFAKLGYKTPADFDRFDLFQLYVFIYNQFVQGYFFTSDFIENGMLAPGSDILKRGGIVLPRLLQTNRKASNGVVHIIDQVFLP